MQTVLQMLTSSLSHISKEIIACPGYDVKLLIYRSVFGLGKSEGQIERGK